MAERFASAVNESSMRRPVPWCPGWSVFDLVSHLGNIHAWAATILETGEEAFEQQDKPATHRAKTSSAWYAAKAEDLYRVMRNSDPDAPCWNFVFGTGTALFWHRRQVHETMMHLVDIDASEGRTTDISPAVAADGIAEVLTVFLPRMHVRGLQTTLTAPMSLVANDIDRVWTLTPRPLPPPAPSDNLFPTQQRSASATLLEPDHDGPPLVVERLHPQADRVEAPADVLLRMLWKRQPAKHPSLFVSGNLERVKAFFGSALVP